LLLASRPPATLQALALTGLSAAKAWPADETEISSAAPARATAALLYPRMTLIGPPARIQVVHFHCN
jgi:hypothetical protein